MFKPVRLLATIVFLASIALVFVGAFVIGNDVCPPAPLLGSYSPLVQVLCLSKSRRHSPTPSDLFRSICHHRVPRIYLVLSFLHPVRTLCRLEAGRHELEH